MEKYKVVIMILNWKQPKSTITCVESVLANSYQDFKLFIINNDSYDISVSILNQRFKNNSKIEIIQTGKNLGFGGGNNYGVTKASRKYQFEYICFLNNDTIVDKNFLQSLLEASNRLGKPHIYFPILLNWDSNVIQSAGLKDYIPRPFQFNHARKMYSNNFQTEQLPYLGGCCFLITKKLFSALSGFRTDFFLYCEDVDLGMKAKKLDTKFYLVPKSIVWHKGNSSIQSFIPMRMYYSARNTMYLINDYANNKKCEYIRAIFWFIVLLWVNLFCLKFKYALALVAGLHAFARGEKGKKSVVFSAV